MGVRAERACTMMVSPVDSSMRSSYLSLNRSPQPDIGGRDPDGSPGGPRAAETRSRAREARQARNALEKVFTKATPPCRRSQSVWCSLSVICDIWTHGLYRDRSTHMGIILVADHTHKEPWTKIANALFLLFIFELNFDVNRNKRRHTQHDAKHTIA